MFSKCGISNSDNNSLLIFISSSNNFPLYMLSYLLSFATYISFLSLCGGPALSHTPPYIYYLLDINNFLNEMLV